LRILLEPSCWSLLPRILGPQGEPDTWKIRPYKGIGHIPKNLSAQSDPRKTTLLGDLPPMLRGLSKTPTIEAVVVVLDADQRDCRDFLTELQAVAHQCAPALKTMFRLAIEEIEAWYLGDRQALKIAYPNVKAKVLQNYQQDSPIGTWELLAQAIDPKSWKAIQDNYGPLPGDLKHEWAEKIGPIMSLESNASPSFRKFRDGLRRLVSAS
jgi:hypothetical protein